MMQFKKVAIIGTGLIGGSLALAIKKNRLAKKIVGVSRHKKSLALAKRIGAIDQGSLGLGIIKGADFIIFAAPVKAIINLAPLVSKVASKDCLVIDVGSTKEKIVSSLSKFFPNYVGAHPLAGSEKRSVANASALLFKGSLCILTPVKRTNRKALRKLNLFWKRLGVKTTILTPAKHDEVLSFVSHLPHIVAFSLINSVPGHCLKFASTGLKDTTRIAASDSELWSEIFLSNKENLLKAIEILENNIKLIKSGILKRDAKKLEIILKQAKAKRISLSKS